MNYFKSIVDSMFSVQRVTQADIDALTNAASENRGDVNVLDEAFGRVQDRFDQMEDRSDVLAMLIGGLYLITLTMVLVELL